ncbi:MerR family transcriptional regulator [Virgibacillus necropolis]|uniref:MerR family transcriptional regulator n=1 Tax=Virgibacillus necropolis TaxID=163877 RepID=UPI00384A4E27
MKFHSTGEVSKMLNISVRTLRYYDQIGLMSPNKKDEHGKRFYSDEDLLILKKITILKMLNLSLNNIGKILSKITMEKLLYVHRDYLQQKMEGYHASVKHTNSLLNSIKLEGDLKWEQLIPLIQEDQTKGSADEKWNKYFGLQEQVTLKGNLPKLEQDNPQVRRWINLNRRIELCLKRGDSPKSEEGQIIAEETLFLSEELFEGDEQLGDKFFEIRKSPEKSREINLYPVKEKVLDFVEEAIQLFEENMHVK